MRALFYLALAFNCTFAFANLNLDVRGETKAMVPASGQAVNSDQERGITTITLVRKSTKQVIAKSQDLAVADAYTAYDKNGKARLRATQYVSHLSMFDQVDLIDNSGRAYPQSIQGGLGAVASVFSARDAIQQISASCPLIIRVHERSATIVSIRRSKDCRRFSEL